MDSQYPPPPSQASLAADSDLGFHLCWLAQLMRGPRPTLVLIRSPVLALEEALSNRCNVRSTLI